MSDIFNKLKKLADCNNESFTSKAFELDEKTLTAYEQAKEKIKKESDESDDPNIKYTGEFLLQTLENNPTWADKFLQEEKSIEKSINEMQKVAKERAKGKQMVIISDKEGFEIILKYFDIENK